MQIRRQLTIIYSSFSSYPNVDRNPETFPSAKRETQSPRWRKDVAPRISPILPVFSLTTEGVHSHLSLFRVITDYRLRWIPISRRTRQKLPLEQEYRCCIQLPRLLRRSHVSNMQKLVLYPRCAFYKCTFAIMEERGQYTQDGYP